MRIPLPIVILSIASVIGGVWWNGTRDKSFLNNPGESPNENVSLLGKQTGQPATDALPEAPPTEDDPPADPDPLPVPENQPEVPTEALPLDLYREDVPQIPTELIRISHSHELEGEYAAALLAAERLIDSAEADDEQTTQALEMIHRLRPKLLEQNTVPNEPLPVTFCAGTGRSNAKLVEAHLQKLAEEIQTASCGILRVSIHLIEGKDVPGAIGSPPVAIWFTGGNEHAKSTETFIYTAPKTDFGMEKLTEAILKLLRSNLARSTSLHIPEMRMIAPEEHYPQLNLVTRLVWWELGRNLNPAND